LLKELHHPNIIKQFFTFQDDTNLYYVFEFASRGSLTKLINKFKDGHKMPLDLVKYYSAEIISALELMHSKNMIHRDLKPENILITEDWNIKLVSMNDLLIL